MTSSEASFLVYFHHGDFDNHYGDGTVSNAASNGRIYANSNTADLPDNFGTFVVSGTSEGQTTYLWTPPVAESGGNIQSDVLVVGGGGGGGTGRGRGGGGAGGIVFMENMNLSTTSITVGKGGDGGVLVGNTFMTSERNGSPGFDSLFGSAVAIGGGFGGRPGGSGGSGGGNRHNTKEPPSYALQPNSESGGFGNPGGATTGNNDVGSGGGGAGSSGSDDIDGGHGGSGKAFDIEGVSKYYGGGGGGGAMSGKNSYSTGGIGGGGSGGIGAGSGGDGNPGDAHSGGGGGGGGYGAGTDTNGGNGGSGIVIIRISNVVNRLELKIEDGTGESETDLKHFVEDVQFQKGLTYTLSGSSSAFDLSANGIITFKPGTAVPEVTTSTITVANGYQNTSGFDLLTISAYLRIVSSMGTTNVLTSETVMYNLDEYFMYADSYEVTSDPYNTTRIIGRTLYVQARNRNLSHEVVVTASNAFASLSQTLVVQESIDAILAAVDDTLVTYSLNFHDDTNTRRDFGDYDVLYALYGQGTYFKFYGMGMIAPDTSEQFYMCRVRFNRAQNSVIKNTTLEYTRDDGVTWTSVPSRNEPSGIPILMRSSDRNPEDKFILPYAIYVIEYEYPSRSVPQGSLWTKTDDLAEGLNQQMYSTYKTEVSSDQTYGNRVYTAWANSVLSYNTTSAWAPSKLFDKKSHREFGQTYGSWQSEESITNIADAASPLVVSIQLAKSIFVHRYTFESNNNIPLDGDNNDMPSKWTMEGSVDGVSWALIDSRDNETNWTPGEIREYSVSSPQVGYYFRTTIYRNNSPSLRTVQISEWILYGRPNILLPDEHVEPLRFTETVNGYISDCIIINETNPDPSIAADGIEDTTRILTNTEAWSNMPYLYYILLPNDPHDPNSNSPHVGLRYTFYITVASDYIVQVTRYSQSAGTDSFYMQLNNGPLEIFHVDGNPHIGAGIGSRNWRTVSLVAGYHSVTVYRRELTGFGGIKLLSV